MKKRRGAYDHEYYQKHKKQICYQNEKYRKANQDKINTKMRLRYKNDSKYREFKRFLWVRWKYGLEKDEYLQLFKQQKSKCKLCNKSVKLMVDHNHKTGRVRGLVCSNCNVRLSWFDNKKQFNKVLKYLEA